MVDRICFISSYFPPVSIGGVERYVLNISESLHKQGIDSSIVTRHFLHLPRYDRRKFCQIYRVGINPIPASRYRQIRYVSQLLAPITFIGTGIHNAIEASKDADIIHSQLGTAYDLQFGNIICMKTRKKHVVTVHGRFGKGAEDLDPRLVNTLLRADQIVVNRKESLEYLVERDAQNITLLRNPIPIGHYQRTTNIDQEMQDKREITLLFVGRLSYRRGPQLALQAFARIHSDYPNARLLIVGEGDLSSVLNEFVNKHDIAHQVEFLGRQMDVRPYLWKSDIFLATSPIANSPSLSLREAMAAGLAVVATDVEETSEIVSDDETGILVDPSPESVGNGLRKLLDNYEVLARMKRTAADYAETFRIDKYTSELVEIYNKMEVS